MTARGYPKETDWRASADLRQAHNRSCHEQSNELREMPADQVASTSTARAMRSKPLRAWRSRRFLVILFEDRLRQRLTIHRTKLLDDGHWEEGITWDEIQRCKRECGYGDQWAVECYPPDADVVDVAAMRHIWLLSEEPTVGWKRGAT